MQILRQNRGGVAILIGLCATVLFGFVALVIDIGYGLVARNELHNVADAAALAATRQLGRIYIAMPQADQINYVLTATDGNDVRNEAINVAAMNYAAGQNVMVDVGDIEIGQWDTDTKTFTVTDTKPSAVRVTARRDGQTNGPISTFFARIIGHDTMTVTANATAALTGLGKVFEGELDLPFGIDIDLWDQPDACGTDIVFFPTGDQSCAGWTTFDLNSNGANIDYILDGMYDGTYENPVIYSGQQTIEFIGGNVASALPEVKRNFEAAPKECCIPNNDGVMVEYWKATIVVYQDEVEGCSNVSGATTIAGFATVNIHTVLAPPDGQYIGARIDCENIVDGQGGGANVGVIGSIPKLVQ